MSETAARFIARTCRIPPADNLVLRHATAEDAEQGCAMCAGPVAVGDACISVNDVSSTFTSQPQLSPGRVVCEACTRLGSQDWMQKYATGIVTGGAVYPFRKLVDVAYWMANPPREPYVMAVTTAKVQHIFWCAEVSQPGDVGMLCLGGRNFPIRYRRLRTAWSTALDFRNRLALAQDEAPTRTARAALPAPHGLVVNAYESTHSAEISRVANERERSAVAGLNPGEIFLLARIQAQIPDSLERPSPIFTAG